MGRGSVPQTRSSRDCREDPGKRHS